MFTQKKNMKYLSDSHQLRFFVLFKIDFTHFPSAIPNLCKKKVCVEIRMNT